MSPMRLRRSTRTSTGGGVADLGNVLRHAYDQVMDHRIWQIVTADLAPLKAAVETMLREVKEDSA